MLELSLEVYGSLTRAQKEELGVLMDEVERRHVAAVVVLAKVRLVLMVCGEAGEEV